MIRIPELKLPLGSDPALLVSKIRKSLRLRAGDSFEWRILRHSVDARKKPLLYDVYTVGVSLGDAGKEQARAARLKNPGIRYEEPKELVIPVVSAKEDAPRPVITGFGPCGIFAALILAKAGLRPLVLERGAAMEERIEDVRSFFETGLLKPDSNVQFGEGGAGTFSDGKLSCGNADRDGLQRFVLERFAEAGAPPEILYEQLPHIGTDRLRGVITNLRKTIEELGGTILFQTRLEELRIVDGQLREAVIRSGNGTRTIPVKSLILATGHSARDTFRMLYKAGVPMEAKNFALGFRVSHPQSFVNEIRYGFSDEEQLNRYHLPAASYKLTGRTSGGRAVYSFCMCPGGYIVNASSAEGGLAVNGMSNEARDSARANSAIVLSVGPKDYGSSSPLCGMYYQEKLEERAHRMAKGLIPLEFWADFRQNVPKKEEPGASKDAVRPLSKEECDALCIKGGAAFAPLHTLLSDELTAAFCEGMEAFDRRMPGFASDDCLVAGPESRTSSPVRITRGTDGQSLIRGLYPAGEGAGYAGGIMSAATDGIRSALLLLEHET